jgi:pilus assembly protein TadC
MENPFRIFGRIVTGKKYKALEQRLKYSGLKINPFDFVGFNVLAGAVLSIVCFYVVLVWQNSMFFALIGTGMTAFIYYILVSTIVSMNSDQRARYVETVLPDALQLMSANLRSGVSTDEALVRSARPEFGFLADRIRIAGDKIATGVIFAEAFREIPKDVDSDILRQTIDLIIEGETSGGELSSILESTAVDIRDTATIQKEIRSVITVYAMFIFIAIAIIAPILYAVSSQLAGILSQLSKSIAGQFLTTKSPTLQLAPSLISQDFLLMFSYVNLIVTGVFGSLMIALINRGNEKFGLRYIPIILGISLGLFYIGGLVMKAFFGGIRVL